MYNFLLFNIVILWLIILLLLALSFKRANQPLSGSPVLKKLPIGQVAPDFSALALDGSKVTLSSYIKSPTCFIFVQPHCESCREKVPTLNRLYAKAHSHSVDLILVSISDVENAKTMVK